MNTAVLGMGTNIGDRIQNCNTALQALTQLPSTKILQISRVYETQPMGDTEQPLFYNACVLLETNLSPHTLLGACLGIEASMGRKRTERAAARIMDLDLLLFEAVRSDSFELTLPHPRILQRAFVMVPLLDLYPTGRAPGLYFMKDLREIDQSGVQIAKEQIVMK